MDVGFIGMGRMGKAMVRNLLKAGHRVRAWDKSPDALNEIRKDGAEIVANAQDAVHGDAVISMLPNDNAMRETFIDRPVLPKNGSTAIHINTATASIECTDELVAAHAAKGIPYISATVFGRPEMAAERNLNILAAGDPAMIARVQPLFDAMGKKPWQLGNVQRNSNVPKIASNLTPSPRKGGKGRCHNSEIDRGHRYLAARSRSHWAFRSARRPWPRASRLPLAAAWA